MKNGTIFMRLSIENVMGVDPEQPIRCLGYDSASYQEMRLQNQRVGSVPQKYGVITIVLNFSDTKINKPRTLHNFLKDVISQAPAGTDKYMIDITVNAFDIRRMSEAEIDRRFSSDFGRLAPALDLTEYYLDSILAAIADGYENPVLTVKLIGAIPKSEGIIQFVKAFESCVVKEGAATMETSIETSFDRFIKAKEDAAVAAALEQYQEYLKKKNTEIATANAIAASAQAAAESAQAAAESAQAAAESAQASAATTQATAAAERVQYQEGLKKKDEEIKTANAALAAMQEKYHILISWISSQGLSLPSDLPPA